MSRFAAVPTAALDDLRLEALHIRVLTAVCSYADKDGWCRVGQDKIAERARTNPARVSQCIKDLSEWGWMRRQRVGKKKVNVYQVLTDCEIDPTIDLPSEQDELADTANHVTCQPGKPNLPPEQITLAPSANPLGTPFSNTVSNTASATAARVEIMDRILAAGGPGMADPAKDHLPRLSLARRITAWLDAWDLEADILPVVAARTSRPRIKPLRDLSNIEPDIAAHHAARTQPVPIAEAPHDPQTDHRVRGAVPRPDGAAVHGQAPAGDIVARTLREFVREDEVRRAG